MNTSHYHHEARALHAHAAQVDAARRRAEALRRAAIDEFASALLRVAAQAWRRATRALPARASTTTHHHPTKA
jgi:hypothetical protein